MAMISPFKDYETTRSLVSMSRLYYETEKKKEELERDLNQKNKRLADIAKRIRQVISEDDEFTIWKNNYVTGSGNGAAIIGFVESMLGTNDTDSVIPFIMKTLKYPYEHYTKEYWEKQISDGRFGADNGTVDAAEDATDTNDATNGNPVNDVQSIPSILTKDGIADMLKRERLVPGENLRTFEVEYDQSGRVTKLHIEIIPE